MTNTQTAAYNALKAYMVGSKLDDSFYEMVLLRLDSVGYELSASDSWLIGFIVEKNEKHIMNACNRSSVPEELYHVLCDMVCGEFLYNKRVSGQLDISTLDLTGAVTSIHEGDTTVNFDAGSTDEAKFTALIGYMMTGREGDLVRYRKLCW